MNGRKVLILLKGDDASQRCVDFTIRLFNEMKILAVVGFIPTVTVVDNLEKKASIREAILESYSNDPNVRLILRHGSAFTSNEITRESLYADLIIMQSSLMEDHNSSWYEEFSAGLDASPFHVPVIVVPENAQAVNEVLVTYDGQKSTFSAIKQFCQIMSNLCQSVQVTLLELNHNQADFSSGEERLLVEYLTEHCENIGIYKVSDESPEKVLKLIDSSKKALVVAGTLDSLRASLAQLPGLGNRLIHENNLAGFYGVA